MAIMGFLVHTGTEYCGQVEAAVAAMPEMTTYGIHRNAYVVTVAEAPSHMLESLLDRIRALDGVMACYVTSLNMEDELPAQPSPR